MVYSILQTVVFLIPVCTLVWKASQLSAKIDNNTADIAELKTSEKEFRNVISVIKSDLNDIKVSLAVLTEKMIK